MVSVSLSVSLLLVFVRLSLASCLLSASLLSLFQSFSPLRAAPPCASLPYLPFPIALSLYLSLSAGVSQSPPALCLLQLSGCWRGGRGWGSRAQALGPSAVAPPSLSLPPALFGRRGAWHCGSHLPGDAPSPPPLPDTVRSAGRSPRDIHAETGTQGERLRPRETHTTSEMPARGTGSVRVGLRSLFLPWLRASQAPHTHLLQAGSRCPVCLPNCPSVLHSQPGQRFLGVCARLCVHVCKLSGLCVSVVCVMLWGGLAAFSWDRGTSVTAHVNVACGEVCVPGHSD